MSWFLTRKNLLKVAIVVFAIVLVCTRLWYIVLLCIGMIWLLRRVNTYVVSGIFLERKKLSAGREVKEIEGVVIGSCVSKKLLLKEFGSNMLFLVAPSRCVEMSFVILQHVVACLNEGGRVCIVLPHSNGCKRHDVSIFDVPYLSQITKLEMNVHNNKKKMKYPLLYSPLESLSYVWGMLLRRRLRQIVYEDGRIGELCRRKRLNLSFYSC